MFKSLIFPLLFVGGCVALSCDPIKTNSGTVLRPDGATEPVAIPPNFNCLYKIDAPQKFYAVIELDHQLKGPNDLITVTDGLGKRIMVSSRTTGINGVSRFYVFPNTTSTVQVLTKSVDMGSKFRMVVSWMKMPNPDIRKIATADPIMNYEYLNNVLLDAHRNPMLKIGEEPLVMTVANSYWDMEQLANYFVIDGDFNNTRAVYHLSDFTDRPFVSTGNRVAIVGLGTRISKCAVVFTPISKTLYYDSMSALATYGERHSITLNSQNAFTNSLTVISQNNQTLLYDMNIIGTPSPSCSILAVETPPTPTSRVLEDLRNLPNMPYMMLYKKFAVIVKDCAVTFSMVAPDLDDYRFHFDDKYV